MTRSAPGRTATAGTSRPVFSSHRRVRNRRASSVDSNGTAASFTVDSDTEIHVTRARVPHHVDEIDSIVLNTSRSLFRVASVRRAVAYAVDGEALLHATGSSRASSPTRSTRERVPARLPLEAHRLHRVRTRRPQRS
jgi:hypothetical protein